MRGLEVYEGNINLMKSKAINIILQNNQLMMVIFTDP